MYAHAFWGGLSLHSAFLIPKFHYNEISLFHYNAIKIYQNNFIILVPEGKEEVSYFQALKDLKALYKEQVIKEQLHFEEKSSWSCWGPWKTDNGRGRGVKQDSPATRTECCKVNWILLNAEMPWIGKVKRKANAAGMQVGLAPKAAWLPGLCWKRIFTGMSISRWEAEHHSLCFPMQGRRQERGTKAQRSLQITSPMVMERCSVILICYYTSKV